MTCKWACIDGDFILAREARVPVLDRGFLFAHAAYEVTAVYSGAAVDLPAHMARLGRTLDGIAIPPLAHDVPALHRELIARNGLEEGFIYLHVTAGDEDSRSFPGPEVITPRLIMFAQEKRLLTNVARDGASAITLADTRWGRRDLKTTQLLSQALAYREARARGAVTAIMHEDGVVTEAASANAWIVTPGGALVTRNTSPSILAGITRAAVLGQGGLEVDERAFTVEEMMGAREVFLTSASTLLLPITQIDGKVIANGAPGRVTRAVQRAYCKRMGASDQAVSDWLG